MGFAKNLARDPEPADMHNAAPIAAGIRRRRPSDANWPSQADWKRLNDEVDGNLIPVEFPIEACVKDTASAGCQNLLDNIHNPLLHRRPAGIDTNLGMGGCVGEQTQRLRRGGKQRRTHRGGGELRKGKRFAAGGEGRRAQLSGNLERGGFAAGVDAAHA